MYQWGNAAGDPEMYGGYLLDPNSIFSAFKAEDLRETFAALLREPDEETRFSGYRDAHRTAVEKGYSIPLLQSTKTVVHQSNVDFVMYDNGWILPQAWSLNA